jgi:hypothetical protein
MKERWVRSVYLRGSGIHEGTGVEDDQ